MKIISWNVNGLRAVLRKGAFTWVFEESPDIVCLQEIKSTIKDLPPELQSPLGYYSYFNSPKKKKGYSGVAIYTKVKPTEVIYDIGEDEEGRLIELHFGSDETSWVLFNVYFPNGGGGPERLKYKLEFYKRFLARIISLRKKGKSIIFCGDVNTAHTEVDLARPKENVNNTGFLPIERKWIDDVIKSGFIDIFRNKFPDIKEVYTYWDMKTFSRERNVGWRIDYFFVSEDLTGKIKNTEVLSHIFGSDHCPISLDIDI